MSRICAVVEGDVSRCLRRHARGPSSLARHVKKCTLGPISPAQLKLFKPSSSLKEDVTWHTAVTRSPKDDAASIQRLIMYRDAKFRDIPDVAGTHCQSFYPESQPPLDFLLWLDKYVMHVRRAVYFTIVRISLVSILEKKI
eukprot:jgi/Mesvir1/17963/Mv25373-RA.2